MSDLSYNSANETPFNYWYPTTRHRQNFNGSIKNHNCSICMYKHYDYFTNFLVHVINIRVPDGGSTDTARESGSAYTKIQRAMIKGSFQVWGDMQPNDFCLARQNPFITLHPWMSIWTHNEQINTQQNLHSELESVAVLAEPPQTCSAPPPGTTLGRYKISLMSSYLELGHVRATMMKRQKSIYSKFIWPAE